MSLLGDGGAVYTNGITGTSMANGEKVINNVVHDQMNTAGGHVLYTDNGATFVTIGSNAVWNIHVSPWGSRHGNYTLNDGTNDPTLIEGNYWPNGPGDSNSKGVVVQNNHNITSPSQIPASMISAGGIESQYQSILNWQPA
jgi:hypothetical protein